MTIIAYRNGVLACDSLVSTLTGGDPIIFSRQNQKIIETDRGLFGFSGSTAKCFQWEKWAKDGANINKMPAEVISGLWLDSEGSVFFLEKGCYWEVPDDYIACGSGMNVAMGAFYMGATAAEAVEACIALSPGCGGEVQEYTI